MRHGSFISAVIIVEEMEAAVMVDLKEDMPCANIHVAIALVDAVKKVSACLEAIPRRLDEGSYQANRPEGILSNGWFRRINLDR